MQHLLISRACSFLLSFMLLVGPLPLSAVAQNIMHTISEFEKNKIKEESENHYIYLGEDLSNIGAVISTISDLDQDPNSPVHELKKHLDEGFIIGHFNAVAESIEHAQLVLQKQYNSLDKQYADDMLDQLNIITKKLSNGSLIVNSTTVSRAENLATTVIKKHFHVQGKTTLDNDVKVKHDVHILGHLKVDKSANFNDDVKIKGNLSVADLTVESCIDNLCVNSLSVTDAFITNSSIENLTISGTILDAIIENASIGTASIDDAIVQNLTVGNCMTNLCVNNLSVTDESVSGTLSVNNGVIENLIISGSPTVISSFTSAGVVHNDAIGVLSSSLIVDADIDNATISNTKLATVSSSNIANNIVTRDISGDFSAGIITANLIGNATTATTAVNFTGSLAGDVTGTQGATVVSTVGGETAANIAAGAVLANAATNLNTANTIVKRDGSGDFAAGTITANLVGNATTATTAVNFTGSLAGDVTGTQGATVVSTVGGETAVNIAAGAVLANAATNLNTANTIVKRDGSGDFAAGTITANLIGSSSLNVLKSGDTMTGTLIMPAGATATPSIQFTGSTNTGLSAPVANTLSFDVNGTEQVAINTTNITITPQMLLLNPWCNQAIQVATPLDLSTVTANPTTSILLLKPAGTLPITVTVQFPAAPTNGQYFSVVLGSNLALTAINDGNGALIANGLTAFAFGVGFSSSTYVYYATDNTWYRCG
ncbi:MAG TPA: hypothetical protein VLB80_01905 [Candidatus Babeliales bacterium]|nr:hypothetical protein [Candidatus Babeliales bacterium]